MQVKRKETQKTQTEQEEKKTKLQTDKGGGKKGK